MIGNNEFKISITGILDTNATATEINTALNSIKKKLNKIDLQFNIDDSIKKTLADFTKAMDGFRNSTESNNNILKEEKVIIKETDGVIKEKIRQHLKSGEVIERETTKINNKIKAIKEEQIETKKLISEYEKLGQVQKKVQRQDSKGNTTSNTLKIKNNYNDTTVKADGSGNVTSITNTQNLDKERKATESLIAAKNNLNKNLKSLEIQGKLTSRTFEKMSNTINVAEDIDQLKRLEQTMKMLERNHNRKVSQGELIGSDQGLKNLTKANNDYVVSLLRSNNVIKDQQVLASSLNRETGHWAVTIKNSAKEQTTLTGHINTANGAIYKQSEAVKDLSAKNLGFAQQFNIAMQRTVIWAGAMTSIYGTIHGFSQMLEEIKLVDQAMTELKRVFDATPQQYNSMLQESIEMSRQLGNNVHDVLQSLNEVARSYGDTMSQADMLSVTRTSMLASNVSDLSAEDAMKNLIGTMNAYKIAASESIQIVDKMNEVDNNYSISTQQLSEAMQKSAGVAKVYGVSLDELIGNITSIGAVTMESGSQIGRALKTIYSRITTLDKAKEALQAVGISIYDMEGKVRPVSDILESLANKWNSLTDEQRQFTAVEVAGRDQLTRLVAMMENYNMSVQATQTSLNSANSAITENMKYQESMEAKLNKLKTSFTEMSLAVGQAFLTDGFLGAIELLNNLAKGVTLVSSSVGVLPIIFGAVSMALVGLSKEFRKTVVDMTIFDAATKGLALSATGLKLALKGLIAVTGVGLVFAGVGIVLEKLIGKYSEAKQASEKFSEQQKINSDLFKENKDEIAKLADKYAEYEQKLANGDRSTETLKEFNRIRQELSSKYPALITGEDAYGNKLLGTSAQIEQQIRLAERRLEVEQRLEATKNKKEAKENFDTARDDYNSVQNKINNFTDGMPSNLKINSNKELLSLYDEFERRRQKLLDGGKDLSSMEMDTYNFLKNQVEELNSLQDEATYSSMILSDATSKYVNNLMQADDKTSMAVDNIVSSFSSMVLASEGSSKDINAILDDIVNGIETGKFKKDFHDLEIAMQKYKDAEKNNLTGEKLEEYRKKAEAEVNNIKKIFLSLARAKFGGDSKEYKNIASNFEAMVPQIVGFANATDKANDSSSKLKSTTNMSTKELIAHSISIAKNSKEVANNSVATEENSDATEENTQSKYANMTASEARAGIMQSEIDEALKHISVYEALSNQEYTNEAQKYALAEATEYLATTYPHLINGKEMNIEAARKEAEANNILLQASEASANGQLSAQENATLNSALGTKARIDHIKKELLALETLNKSWKAAAGMAASAALVAPFAPGMMQIATSMEAMSQMSTFQASDKIAELDSLQGQLEGFTGTLSKVPSVANKVDKSLGKVNDKTKENAEETQYGTIELDKYTKALDEVNLRLKKQEDLMKRYPKWHKENRKAIQEEIRLLKERSSLLDAKEKDLAQKVRNGETYPTGNSYSMAGSLPSGGGYGGGYTGKYSREINAAAKKYNVDPNLIAAIIKQESNFNPRARSYAGASGLMQLMPATARGLGVKNVWNVQQNIDGGTKYISQMLRMFGNDLTKALAAYNAGPGNVRKYGGVPPFRETRNYIQKVKSNYSSFKGAKASSGYRSNSANQRIASHYLNQFTISDGYKPSHRPNHAAVDFNKRGTSGNQDMGTPILSLSSGTVTEVYRNNPSAGNGITIQGDDGYEYRYIHMQHPPKFKKGDRVGVGQNLGGIGNTGRSSAAHLDLRVRKNGKTVNPLSVIRNMAAGKINVPQDIADQFNEQRGYESDLMSVREQEIANEQALREAIYKLYDANLSVYEKRIAQYDFELQMIEQQMDNYPEDSNSYRNLNKKSQGVLRKKQKEVASQIAYLESLVKKGNVDPHQRDVYNNLLREMKIKREELFKEEQNLLESYHDSILSTYRTKMDAVDNLLENIDNQIKDYEPSTQSFRNMQIKKSDVLYEKQRANASGIAYLEKLLRDPKNKLDPTLIQKYREELENLRQERKELFRQQEDVSWEKVNSYLEEHGEILDDINDSYSLASLKLERLDEESSEYAKGLADQVAMIQEKIEAYEAYMRVIEKVLITEKLSVEKQKELKEILEDTAIAIEEAKNEQIQTRKDFSDEIIGILKESIEKQRDLEIKSAQKRLEEKEKEHKENLKRYEEDAKAFNEAINSKIEALEKEQRNKNYRDEVEDLQEEEAKLRKQINELLIDDSYEADAKRKDLQKQLDDILDQKEKMQYDRSIELQKEALEKQRENYNEDLDNKTKTEEEKIEEVRKNIEQEIEEIEWKYNEILNDERYFNDLRKQILDGNLKNIQEKLKTYLESFKSYNLETIKEIQESWTGLQSLIDKIKNTMTLGDSVSSKTGAGQDSGTITTAKDKDLQSYLENKRLIQLENPDSTRKKQLMEQNEMLRAKWGFKDGSYFDIAKELSPNHFETTKQKYINEVIENKRKFQFDKEKLSSDELSQLTERNNKLRNLFDIEDGTYSDLLKQHNIKKYEEERKKAWSKYLTNKRLSEYNNPDPKRKKELQHENSLLRGVWKFPDGRYNNLKKLKEYHKGGIVGDKTTKLGEILNKLANNKPNEQVVNSLKGELQIPPQNFPNVIENMKKIVAKVAPNIMPLNVGMGGDSPIEINFNIDKMYGTDKEVEEFGKKTMNWIKRNRGGRLK